MSDAILKGNLDRLKQLNDEEAALVKAVEAATQNLFNTRAKRDALKEFLKRELDGAGSNLSWATQQYALIFNPNGIQSGKSTNGHEPNKTHIVLNIVREHSHQKPTALYKFAEPQDIGLNYFHTILGKLRKRELIDKDAKSRYFATEKGKTVELDI